MNVVKRNGDIEEVSFDKILKRIKNLSHNLNVNIFEISQKVCSRIYDGISTSQIDELTSTICSSMIVIHPDYNQLAARIAVSNHHKNTSPSFSETISILFNASSSPSSSSLNNNNNNNNNNNKIITEELYNLVMNNREKLNAYIKYDRDYLFDFFGFKTLERSYLLKVNDKIVERPQHLFMRVALAIHQKDIKDALETYDYMSQKYFIHATPTLFNAGTPKAQCSSCYLLQMESDSIEGIYNTLKESALISKYAGGIGIHCSNIRASGSKIRNTGVSSGITPMLKVFNSTMRYVNQEGKRNGSCAFYLEPWHADIFEFLELKRPHGIEETKCRDLFYAIWMCDLFMKRVKNNEMWSLMSPDICPNLQDVYDEEFEKLYIKYESEGKFVRQVKAQELWFKILESQIETGTPYIVYKDSVNLKSNQKNIGTIKSSNLCVHPDTNILTDEGYMKIGDLENKEINVWNGKEFSKTVVRKTGENQKILTVKFSCGVEIKCTPYHKFYIEMAKRPADKSRVSIVEAKDLVSGMKIIRYNLPTISNGDKQLKYPYTHGFFCADGTYCKSNDEPKQCNFQKLNGDFCGRHQTFPKVYDSDVYCCAQTGQSKPKISLYGNKKNLLQYFDYRFAYENSYSKTLDILLPIDIESKYFVPINYDLNSKLRWLEGYLDGDGCVVLSNDIKNIQVTSIEKDFLVNVLYLLNTLGVVCKISVSNKNRKTMLPDGKGGMKEFNCRESYRLNIHGDAVIHLVQLGFSPKRLNLDNIRKSKTKMTRFIKIESVEDNNEYSDTFCVNEPLEHKVIFNGILTLNCSEILEVSNKDEIAVCNLASINLSNFVEFDGEGNNPKFNFELLHKISKILTKNLNKIIDINFYPLEKTRRSNLRHRPIGIGVSGLADTYILMRYPFDSNEATQLNKLIFETIYNGALTQSNLIAKTRHDIYYSSLSSSSSSDNYNLNTNEYENLQEMNSNGYVGAYSSFYGSPAQQGKLQFDLWNEKPDSDRYDWDSLKSDIQKYGLRNSLLVALMPTASTSNILGVSECFEPITSHLYKRKTLSGEFIIINKYLVQDLIKLELWNENVRNKIIINEGCISDIDEIPQDIRNIYKTAFELSQRVLIDQARDRGKYICQTQSMNLFVESPDIKKLSSMHFYSWSVGLKTGIYYLRSKPKGKSQKFTIDPSLQKFSNIKEPENNNNDKKVSKRQFKCDTLDENGACLMCSS